MENKRLPQRKPNERRGKRQLKKVEKEVKKVEKEVKKVVKAVKKPVIRARRRKLQKLTQTTHLARLSNGFNSTATSIASAMTLPMNNPPIRWSSNYSTSETAVANVWEKLKINARSVSTPMDAFTQPVCVFRDPLRHCVIYDPNEETAQYQYLAMFVYLNDGILEGPTDAIPIDPTTDDGEMLSIAYFASNNGVLYQPHGPVLYCGKAKGAEWNFVWIDSGATVTAALNSGAAVAAVTISLGIWKEGVIQYGVNDFEIPIASSTATTVTDQAGYYCIAVQTEEPINLSLDFQGTGPVFAHRTLRSLNNNTGAIDDLRIISLSVQYTNDASALNRQGSISIMQAPSDLDWYNTCIKGYDNFQSLQGCVTTRADNGIYGFAKPTDTRDFDIKSYWTKNSAGLVTNSFFPLAPSSSYLFVMLNITTELGFDGYVTVDANIEYLSTDPFRPKSKPTASPADWELAMRLVRDCPQFHENPLHLKDIGNFLRSSVRSIASGITKYGKPVMEIARLVNTL